MLKPYYHDEASTLYRGDCREILPQLKWSDVGFVLTDPPYGIGLSNNDRDGHRRAASFAIHNDHATEVGDFIVEWARVCDWPIAVFASPWNPWQGEWRNLIVWDKGGAVGGGGDISTCLKRSWELIQVARNGPMCGQRDESVWRFPIVPSDTTLHIAQKPVGLLARIIARFAPENSLILDPCCGSGSTLVAAKLTGHRAIGIEIDEQHCATIVKRLAQGVLFGTEVA